MGSEGKLQGVDERWGEVLLCRFPEPGVRRTISRSALRLGMTATALYKMERRALVALSGYHAGLVRPGVDPEAMARFARSMPTHIVAIACGLSGKSNLREMEDI